MNLNNHDRSLVVFLSFYLLSPANYSWSRSYLALLFFIHSYLTVILKRWYKHFLLKMALNICFKMILCVYMYVEQMKQDGLWVSNCSSEGHRNSLHYFIPVEVWHFPQKKKEKRQALKSQLLVLRIEKVTRLKPWFSRREVQTLKVKEVTWYLVNLPDFKRVITTV